MGQGPGIARVPPAALGQQASVSQPPQHPPGTWLHSVSCSGLAQMPAYAQMFSSAFGTHSFPRSFLLYSLPISKGYLDPLGCLRSSDTPAARSTHRKWILAYACQNSMAEPWGHRAGPGSGGHTGTPPFLSFRGPCSLTPALLCSELLFTQI